jgi:chromate transporter
VDGLLAGVRAAMVAVLVDAIVRLAPAGLATRAQLATGAAALGLALAGLNEITVMLLALAAAGLVTAGIATFARSRALAVEPVTMLALFAVFLKIGALLFGTGYVLVAYLRAEVSSRGWLSEAQVIDAVAAGQLTPGPVNSSATFAGFLIGGVPGAMVATLAIFLPAFAFVLVAAPLGARLRRSARLRLVSDALVAASLGLLAAAAIALGDESLRGALALGVFVAALAVLRLTRLAAGWPIAGGAAAGSLLG